MQNENPMLDFSKLPNLNDINVRNFSSGVKFLYKKHTCLFDDILTNETVGWNSLVVPLERASYEYMSLVGQIYYKKDTKSNLFDNMNDSWWCKEESLFESMKSDVNIYNCLKRTLIAEKDVLSDMQINFLKKKLHIMELNGVNLSPADKKQFDRYQNRLAKLLSLYDENYMKAISKVYINFDESDIDSDNWDKSLYRMKNGKYRYYYDRHQSKFHFFMSHLKNRAKRRELFYKTSTINSEFGPAYLDNRKILNEIADLRLNIANILGYKDHFSMMSKFRVIGNKKDTINFLKNLAKEVTPAAKKELAELKKFAKSNFNIKKLQRWDLCFVYRKMNEEKYNKFSNENFSDYLQFPIVLNSMFDCATKLFGIKFKKMRRKNLRATPTDPVFYSVIDKNGRKIGTIFLDLFNKKGKTQHQNYETSIVGKFAGSRKKFDPIINIFCNFLFEEKNGIQVIPFADVLILFHEFGHAIDDLLSTMADGDSGEITHCIDIVEIPSTFMEKFVYDWDFFSKMTCHIETGKKMPKQLFEKEIINEKKDNVFFLLDHIEYALFDAHIHGNEITDWKKAMKESGKFNVMKRNGWDRYPCFFPEIFNNSSNYDSFYYTYLFSEAISADIFYMFKKSGNIFNKKLGRKFCSTILPKEDCGKFKKSYINLRGRKLSIKPFIRRIKKTII